MKKNVASQTIGAQMVSATDGSAFTGSVTVYVTGDAGTQAAGSVGSGACTHEGNGYHTYAPAQAETNYDLVAFTFTGTGAVPTTVQVFTGYPQTGDSFALIGTAGAGLTNINLPDQTMNITGNITGNLSGSVGSVTGAVGSVTGAVGSVTGNVGGDVVGSVGSVTGAVGSVTGAVGSVTAGVTVTTNNDKTGYGLSAAAVQAIWDALTTALTTVGSIGKKLADWTIGTAQTGDSFARLGAPAGASIAADIATLATQASVDDLPTNAELATALGDIPTATENADALLNRDMSAVADTTARSPLNALRVLRNKWSLSGTTYTVTKEDDATSAWTATVTATPGADPISGSDPA